VDCYSIELDLSATAGVVSVQQTEPWCGIPSSLENGAMYPQTISTICWLLLSWRERCGNFKLLVVIN